MNQKDLMDLLKEASELNCSWQRRNEIQFKLEHQAPIRLSPVIAKVFTDTTKNCSKFLPFLFPFFAIVCGDQKSGFALADVDWSLVDRSHFTD